MGYRQASSPRKIPGAKCVIFQKVGGGGKTQISENCGGGGQLPPILIGYDAPGTGYRSNEGCKYSLGLDQRHSFVIQVLNTRSAEYK